jgi:hypothetical protein
MKRTPGKKVSQGFQQIALASKFQYEKSDTEGEARSVSYISQFEWDMSKGAPGYKKDVDPNMAKVFNAVVRIVSKCIPVGGRNYTLSLDNRFNTPRLMLVLWKLLSVLVIGTLRMNLWPLNYAKKYMLPTTWAAAQVSDKNKAQYRLEPARVASLGGLTTITKFDTGFTKMGTTLPVKASETVEKIRHRRKFLEARTIDKCSPLDLYTSNMDTVDVVDHRMHQHPIKLHSHKWTWTPQCLLIAQAIINVEALHVMLCRRHNEFWKHQNDAMLVPFSARELRRVLGLKMMAYAGNSGYWFEASHFGPAAAAPATPAGKKGMSVKVEAGVRFSSPTAVVTPLCAGDHVPTSCNARTCQYCGVRGTKHRCSICNVGLHVPNSQAAWPCFQRFHDEKFKSKSYGSATSKKDFKMDAECAKVHDSNKLQQKVKRKADDPFVFARVKKSVAVANNGSIF